MKPLASHVPLVDYVNVEKRKDLSEVVERADEIPHEQMLTQYEEER